MGAAARLKAVVLWKPAPEGPAEPEGPVLPVGPVFPLEPLLCLPSQLKQLRGYMYVLLSIF
ncbi:TPA: hypothetical protein QCX97_001635 [Bacillus wiedmannii]|nr:hypothetical protein TU62_17545 [Bacillus cereus]MBG9857975.1 hypothetical protein [Bacillus wiedmannii]HDR7667818.1 hypothetical protein [Bacillus wiedmannii]